MAAYTHAVAPSALGARVAPSPSVPVPAFAPRPSGWWQLLAALLLFLVGAAHAGAATGGAAPSLSEHELEAVVWIDPGGAATLGQAQAALQSDAARVANQEQVMPLGHDAAAWYRLELPAVTTPTRMVFHVTFPGTDHVDLYRPGGPGQWEVQRSGDHVPVSQWPLRSLDPAFIFTVQPAEPPTFLRVANSQPIRVTWRLEDANAFLDTLKTWHLALGAYAGFIAMLVLVSVFNTVSWRDPIHLYYMVHVVLVGLSIMALTGLANDTLWPDSPWWADKAPVVIPGLAIAWMGLFVRELVRERGGRVVSNLLLAHAAIAALMVVGFLLVGRENVYRAPSVYALPGLLFVVGVVTWYSLRRPQVGLWVLGGMMLLVMGAALPLLHNLGVIRSSLLTESGPQLGAALEIPLLLIGLFFRSRERRANRERLEQLATTDPLTGLANHRVLLRRLAELLRRARRDRALGAVFRVHVANLADIAGEHGREAGEAALMRAAECVAREAREGDLVARDPGSDIVLILSGSLTKKAAAEVGRNIIARGLKYSARLPPGVTVKMRIAAVCAPLPESEPAGLLQTLSRLLADMESAEHGRWLRFVGEGDSSSWNRSSSPRPHDTEPPPPPTPEEFASLRRSRPLGAPEIATPRGAHRENLP